MTAATPNPRSSTSTGPASAWGSMPARSSTDAASSAVPIQSSGERRSHTRPRVTARNARTIRKPSMKAIIAAASPTDGSGLRDRLIHEVDEVRHELPFVWLTPEKGHGERDVLGAPGLEENLVSAIALRHLLNREGRILGVQWPLAPVACFINPWYSALAFPVRL